MRALPEWMLRGRAEVHEVAISDQPGRATFYVRAVRQRHGAALRRQP